MSILEVIITAFNSAVMSIGFMMAIAAVWLLILCVQGFIDYIKGEFHAVRGESSAKRP